HLRIIKLLSKLEFNFTYTIVGDGDQKEAVLNEAKKLGVLEKLVHIPFTKQVNQILSKNDMFLQGSFVEGFPNALLESCVAGIPVIAFDVPGGTKEIVEHGINGFLVKNEKE
ncbi:glycosyltransferase, partial [Oceanospirillum sp. D5]|nr:glycosyltransferase [Oceanospirillum sediminis]